MKLMNRLEKFSNKHHFLLFLLIVSVLTICMMYAYNPIYLTGGDLFFHHNRLLVLMDALKQGTFPNYLDYNTLVGYGYFSKAFYSDFTLIPYAIIGNLTSINFAYEFLIFSTTIFSAISTYIFVKRVFGGIFCAAVGAILYSFSAYAIYQTFYFSVISEKITFIFIPIVFLGLYEIINGNYKKWYILAIGFSLIIFSHLLTTILLFIILIFFVLLSYKKFIADKKRIMYLLLAGISSIFLTAYYLLPLFEQLASNEFFFQTKPFYSTIVFKSNLHNLFAGMTNNIPNMNYDTNILPKIGGLLTALICLRLFVIGKSNRLRIIDIGVILGLFFVVTNNEYFPWEIFPFNKLYFIQFPWRLYKYATFFFSIAGAFYLSTILRSDKRKLIALLSISIFLVLTFKYDSFDYKMKMTMHKHWNNSEIDNKIIIPNASIGGGAEYLPSKMPSATYPRERGDSIAKKFDTNVITSFNRYNGQLSFDVNLKKEDILELPLTYYKGYNAVLNGKELLVSESNNGLIEIPINESGQVKVWYGGTLIQKVSSFISLIGILLLCVYVFMLNRKKKGKNNA